jgi:predicted DNA binding protein
MKSVGLRLHPNEQHRHPMHAFVVEHDAFEETRLHHWNPTMSEVNTIVFEIVGSDIDTYEEALAASPTILSYEVAQLPGDSFFIVVEERLNGPGMEQTAAFAQQGLVVVPPVVFDGDGTISITIVGANDSLHSAIDQMPAGIEVEVVSVQTYTGPSGHSLTELSPRQREAVEVAVECGYYHEPRAGSVSDVAAALGCSTGTAAEHLRKAEMKVMASIADSF